MSTGLSLGVLNDTPEGPTDLRASASYVLVVDDDPAVRQLIERCLAPDGYTIKHAPDALSALEAMAERPATLVLCDIRMPGYDGLWLARRLQSEWPSTAIVMVTALDDIRTIHHCRELGAMDYLTKPINRDQLQEVVRRVFPRTAPNAGDSGDTQISHQPLEQAIEAEYTLESPVRCPACGERTNALKAVRLIRARVNFTSTLPRRGRVLACPHCLAMVPAELTNF
jgi:CheY-like chemotaxis protein